MHNGIGIKNKWIYFMDQSLKLIMWKIQLHVYGIPTISG